MRQPPVIIVQLVHIQGPLKGSIQEFAEGKISIGRHPSNLLRFPIDITMVSRHHAEIIREGNRFKLLDLSTNGTFVNGKRVKETYLKSGDVITFAEGGPKVSFLTQVKEGQMPAESDLPPQPPPPAERPPYSPERPPNLPERPPHPPETPPHPPERPPYLSERPPYSPERSPNLPGRPPCSPETPPYLSEKPPCPPERPPHPPEKPPYLSERPPHSPETPPYSPEMPPRPSSVRQEPRLPVDQPAARLQPESSAGENMIVQKVKVPLFIQYGPSLRSFKEVPVTMGRGPDCDLRLDQPDLFDRQAQIFFSQDQYWAKDLTGRGLILINRQPVHLQSPLHPGDELALSSQGPVFRFLGGGRLLEIQEPSPESSGEGQDRSQEPIREDAPQKKEMGGPLSIFKKFLKR